MPSKCRHFENTIQNKRVDFVIELLNETPIRINELVIRIQDNIVINEYSEFGISIFNPDGSLKQGGYTKLNKFKHQNNAYHMSYKCQDVILAKSEVEIELWGVENDGDKVELSIMMQYTGE